MRMIVAISAMIVAGCSAAHQTRRPAPALAEAPPREPFHHVNATDSRLAEFRELGISAARGDLGAIDELDKHKAKIPGEQKSAPSPRLMQAAFEPIGIEAGRGNSKALEALRYAATKRNLRPYVVPAYGVAAGMGSEEALDALVHYKLYGFSLSSVVRALEPAAERKSAKAVDFLVQILNDEKLRRLWPDASKGLVAAAYAGNPEAKAALERYEQQSDEPSSEPKPDPRLAEFRELGASAARGDLAAIDELEHRRVELYADIDYKNDRDRVIANLRLMRAAFEPLGIEAGSSSEPAMEALRYALTKSNLRSFAAYAYGIAAGQGNEEALDALLNYRQSGWLLSTIVSALRPAAERNAARAVSFLVGVINDDKHRGLWRMASEGLVAAAYAGNEEARSALERYQAKAD